MKNRELKESIVIAGGGLTGLMCALKLTQKYPEKNIVLFEKSTKLGGMYGSLSYPGDICFDNGMHVIYESCNPEVDNLYRDIIPESEWNIYEGNEKDIAGLFFRGQLQTYSHYVDLRTFSQSIKNRFLSSFFLNLEDKKITNPKSAMDFLRNQFGNEIVDAVHSPILKMMYGVDAEKLDIFATKATALERVILFDSKTMLDLMKSALLRSRLAFPDQLMLPPVRESTQRALYPKKFRMSHFIDRLRNRLTDKGVEIFTDTDISELKKYDGKIVELTLNNKERGSCIINVDKILWTAGWPALATKLEVDFGDLKFQRGPEMILVNLIFDRPLIMNRLYYFYCYDEGFATFRVTNYSNYCPEAAQGDTYPICVEMWPSKIGKSKVELTEDESINLALNELRKFGVIGSEHKLVFSKMENSIDGFPMPTIENTSALKSIRNRIDEQGISNLTVAGIMATDGLFFIPDILNDAFSKLNDF